MKSLLSFVFAMLFAVTPTFAETLPKAEPDAIWGEISSPESDNLSDFLWTARPVVIFADSPNDPRFEQQLALLKGGADALKERDVVVLSDTDPSMQSALRETLRPRGFMLVLIGKDGGVKLRKAAPWNVRELTRVIDKIPMRQREVSERRQP